MRILVRTSKFAQWSRRFGSLALPLMVLSIFMHRLEFIATETFHLVLGLSIVLAALAVICALFAFVRLWFSGDRGWGWAAIGCIFGAICLSPLVYAGTLWQIFPAVSDVATNPELNLQFAVEPNKLGQNAEVNQTQLLIAFPNMLPRAYQIEVRDMIGLVEEIIADRGWEILQNQEFLGSVDAYGEIRASEMTLFGWRDQIVIRVAEQPGGAMVSMRSASGLAAHDLGRNGRRIESFLTDLDDAVTVYSRNNLATTEARE